MFRTPDDCERKEFINSNPRYKGFCQTYFTAGDEEQFEETRDRLPINPIQKSITTSNNFWDGYKDISSQHCLSTFRYIFNKFKKGIFISIKNNKLETFLPFSKAKFINEWSGQIKFNSDMYGFFKHVASLEGRPFNEHKINKIISRWYGNNCLVRYEFPQSENDTGVHHVKSMLEDLCESKTVPDIELFINRRDFPLLKKDGTEPYDDMWDSTSKPLISHHYEKYAPILSSTTTDAFADIPIPTIDDWARVKFAEGFYFPKTHRRDYTDTFSSDWEDKKPIAVFRGASTGRGTRIDNNQRLKVAYLSSLNDNIDKADNLPYIDAGITDWNVRPRKVFGEPHIQTIEIDKLPFGLVGKLTPEEQSKYKYIIHIDGHSAAFRLSLELAMKSVVLKVDLPYKLWFFDLLKPYEHFIPVKSDLSDLYEKIEWCKAHDLECQRIAMNAYEFYKNKLSKDGILTYLQELIVSLRQNITYNYPKNPVEIHIEECVQTLPFLKPISNRGNVLVNNKLSTVHVKGNIVIKHTEDKKKIKENIHEAFVGLKCINTIAGYTPHFVKVVGITTDYDLVSRYVCDNVTFFSWLGSVNFDFDDYIFILYQLVIGLHIAQSVYEFVHGDLFPWNILLSEKNEPYECVVDGNTVITVGEKSKCKPEFKLPIIIDYGKSRVTFKSKCYEFINTSSASSSFSPVYDVLCVLLSSLNVIIRAKQIRKERDADFLKLINFISGTDFCPDKFTNFQQARQYVFDNSGFSGMLSLELKDLTDVTPLDFCKYLYENFPVLKKMVKIGEYQLLNKKKKNLDVEKFDCKDKLLVYYFFQNLDYDPSKEKEVLASFNQKLSDASFGDYSSGRLTYIKHLVSTYRGKFECGDVF